MKNIKVLHVLYQSLPTVVGSSVRSHSLLKALNYKQNIDLKIITSPFQVPSKKNMEVDIIDGIEYLRTYNKNKSQEYSENNKPFIVKIFKLLSIFSFIYKIKKTIENENIDIVHAHSTFYVGLSSYVASRLTQKKFIYEVRSLWEERMLSSNSISIRLQYKIIKFLEYFTMKLADKVIVINDNLKDNIVERGIDSNKIDIVYNSVDLSNIKILKREDNNINFGYIGLLSKIENIKLLIDTFNKISIKYNNTYLHIFGDGNDRNNILKHIRTLNNERIFLHKKVDYFKICFAYKMIDIFVLTRKKSKLSETVTPLKPLEAMAYGKIVLANNILGFREIIQDKINGYIYKNENDLYLYMEYLINNWNSKNVTKIQENAFSYIKKEKNWDIESEKYLRIYSELMV
jgi:glycosyltransferase involved in cell wall biosynthesis